MGVLIDTGLFVAAHNPRDHNHEGAVILLSEALRGKWGKAYTSDYIFDETVTLALVRTGNRRLIQDLGNSILSSLHLEILRIDGEAFENAWSLFCSRTDKALSFTDCTSLALMDAMNIGHVLSYDAHFDGAGSNITRIVKI